jgi:uncharacterized membrane protein YsdA (DUF1294 family)
MGKSVRRFWRPDWWHGVLALLLGLLGTVGVLWLFHLDVTGFHLLAGWLAAVNLVAFGYYGYDKWCAGRAARRVPELVLHGLSLAGGSLGAYAAMRTFRHKTIKGSFRLVFWVIVVAQAALIVWLGYHLWHGHG